MGGCRDVGDYTLERFTTTPGIPPNPHPARGRKPRVRPPHFRGGTLASFDQGIEDGRHSAFDVGVDVGVGDAEGVEAFSFQHQVSDAVVFGLVVIEVAAAIGFDDQTGLEADEIEKIPPEWRLPPKAKPLRS